MRSTAGSVAPARADRLRHPRDGAGLPRPRPGLEAHPRRAVLRSGVVDEQRRPPRHEHQTGTKYGSSTTVVYGTAVDYLAGARAALRRDRAGAAWTAYRRENCTSTYGCVTSWRELYFDDAQALRAEVRPHQRLRPARRRHLGARLRRDAARALEGASATSSAPDVTPPTVGIQDRRTGPARPRVPGRAGPATDDDAPSPATTCRSRSTAAAGTRGCRRRRAATSDVYAGADGHGYAFRVRARDTARERPAHGPRPRSGCRRRSSRAAASGASSPTACRCGRRVDDVREGRRL